MTITPITQDTAAAAMIVDQARQLGVSRASLIVLIAGITGLGDEVPLHGNWTRIANTAGAQFMGGANPAAVLAEIKRIYQ